MVDCFFSIGSGCDRCTVGIFAGSNSQFVIFVFRGQKTDLAACWLLGGRVKGSIKNDESGQWLFYGIGKTWNVPGAGQVFWIVSGKKSQCKSDP